MPSIRVLQDQDKVMMIKDGTIVADMPWDAALELSRAVYKVAKLAEEYAKVDSIIADGSLLFRAGIPIGLTGNQKMQEEIVKEGLWNRVLRRFLPGGIKSKAVFGCPKVIPSGGKHD